MTTDRLRLPRFAAPVLVLIAAVLPFAPALGGPFLYDDFPAIVKNPSVRSGSAADLFTTGSYWRERSVGYRPVATASFRAGRGLWGESPRAEHAVNIALHAANALLVLSLARAMLGAGGGLAAAVLFAAHPALSEAVCGIAAGRAELLAGLFSLLAIAAATGPRRVPRAAWPVLYLAALLSKESALVLPALVVLAARAAPEEPDGAAPARRVRAAGVLAAAALPLLAWVLLRRAAIGRIGAALPARLDNPLAHAPAGAYLPGALRVASKYLQLLAAPRRLSVDYGYDAIPLPASLLDPSLLPAAAAIAGIAALASRRVRARLHPAAPPLAAALGVALLIPSQAFGPIPALCAERFLYLPAVFAAPLAVALCARAARGRARAAAIALVALLAAAAAWRSAARASDWRSEERLFASSLRAAPRSARLHNVLGLALWNSGRRDEAQAQYAASLAIDPTYVSALVNSGNALMARGDAAGARERYRRALDEDPGHALARWNLAVADETLGETDAAAREYAALAGADPTHFDARLRLGELLARAGETAAARRALDEALALRPGDERARRARAALEAPAPTPPPSPRAAP